MIEHILFRFYITSNFNKKNPKSVIHTQKLKPHGVCVHIQITIIDTKGAGRMARRTAQVGFTTVTQDRSMMACGSTTVSSVAR
jgi:hypothetical protein